MTALVDQENNEGGIAFDDLVFLDEIGAGLFGAVHRGEYLATDVAIKECFRDSGFDYGKYFMREVDMLRAARHPNVVQFIDVCKSEDRFFIVTEYVPGGNLKTWMTDQQRPLSWPQRASFAIDVARALAYLHARNIIHRDIKGENLLVTENGRVKVCDFGFSRLAAQDAEEMKRISYCGTDGYMAPEIMLGMEFDMAVDVFSFGVVLCELCCQQAVDHGQICKRLVPGFGVDPASVTPFVSNGCPDALLDLALRCTQSLPEDRPSWADILKELRILERSLPDAGHVGTLSPSRAPELTLDATEHAPMILQLYEQPLDADATTLAIYDEPDTEESLAVHTGASVYDTLVVQERFGDKRLETGTVTTVVMPNDEPQEMVTVRPRATRQRTALTIPDDTPPASPALPTPADHHSSNAAVSTNPAIPHRFSVIKALTIGKCMVCHRRFGMVPGFKKYLECDDCNYICHRRCAALAPQSCVPTSRLEDDAISVIESSHTM